MLRPSFGSCSSISKRLAGRMPPIAPSVPQNMRVPAGSSGPPGRRDSRSLACAGCERALLVQGALSVDHGEGAHLDRVPMGFDVVKPPERAGDRLAAQLLGQRDAHGLGLAVGVIGADPQPEPVGKENSTGSTSPEVSLRAPRASAPALTSAPRHGSTPAPSWPRHADGGELLDVVAQSPPRRALSSRRSTSASMATARASSRRGQASIDRTEA